MADTADAGRSSFASTLAAVVTTFVFVTPTAALLLGFDWTQAVLLGGLASVVAAISAAVTARRSDAP